MFLFFFFFFSGVCLQNNTPCLFPFYPCARLLPHTLPTMRTHYTLLLALAIVTVASANPADRRPPPLFPQRADTLILGGAGTPEAGSLDSMPTLRQFGCNGNACDGDGHKTSALGAWWRGEGVRALPRIFALGARSTRARRQAAMRHFTRVDGVIQLL